MKVQNPIIGKATGSNQELVYQTYFGNTYVRTKPSIFHYKDSKAQQDTQALFFDIQQQWLHIYEALSDYYTSRQRNDKNVFNVLSAGIYKAIRTYPKSSNLYPPRFFGADDYNQVKAIFEEVFWEFQGKFIEFKFTFSQIQSSRQFSPNTFHLLALNVSQQLIYYINDIFTLPTTNITLTNSSDWLQSDEIRVYIALSDHAFMSNFQLTIQ